MSSEQSSEKWLKVRVFGKFAGSESFFLRITGWRQVV